MRLHAREAAHPRHGLVEFEEDVVPAPQHQRADQGFARRIQANTALFEAGPSPPSKKAALQGRPLYESLIYRALYAYETCDAARADTLLAQAVRLGQRLLDDATEAQQLRASLQGTGTLTFQLDPVAISRDELAAVNLRASACRKP